MARGGHLDVVILGGLQVSADGDLANWWAPYMAAGGMGGAMDLCTDVPELIVVMEHLTRDGGMKILNEMRVPADRRKGLRDEDCHRPGLHRGNAERPRIERAGCRASPPSTCRSAHSRS